MVRFCLTLVLSLVLAPSIADAQLLGGLPFDSRQFRLEQLSENHLQLTGEVEIEGNGGAWLFYADLVDIYPDESRLVASGNVVYATAGSRLAADRVEFDTDQLTGTFYHATGSVNMGEEEIERSMFGTQEPDMYFYGEMIEKLGPRSYRLTNGAFTSCIQPTPRWQVTATSLTLNLDEYAMLRNSVIEVKGVPVFYLPIMYYPIQEDDRATGFLMPTYGASSFRGNSISNAFFLAINRSQDLTVFHDWFSQTGQGVGSEYRYLAGAGSQGYLRAYFLNERETEFIQSGFARTLPARRSYESRGQFTQRLAGGWMARSQVDYFSDITVQQTYHANVFEASSRMRTYSSNIAGALGAYQLSGTVNANETFFGDTDATLYGAGPRVTFSQGQWQIPGVPAYVSFGSEYARLMRRSTFKRGGVEQQIDSGLQRFDINPTIRIPFTKWPFLTFNSSATWRGTYWTESLDPTSEEQGLGLSRGKQIPEGVTRTFLDVQSQITGPSFVKVWDTPNSGYAERMKHVIEPWVNFSRLTAIDNFDEIVQLEGIDSIYGGGTQVRYGINNRIYARRQEVSPVTVGVPPAAVAREIVSVALMQSYYTDSRAARFDRMFMTSFNMTPPSHVSPVSLIVRAQPTRVLGGSMRAEYDTQFGALRTIGAEGTAQFGGWLETRGGWSQRRFVEGLPGFNDPNGLDHYINSFTSMRNRDNTVGGVYSFNYDILRSRYLQQRVRVYYNAQCCGIAAEFQSFNFEGLGTRARVPSDRRFNISFTLAGLGTFANLFGAFGEGNLR